MASFVYADKNGDNEINAEGYISVDKAKGTVSIGILSGDADGGSYTAYIPNHRLQILSLIADLTEALDATADLPRGFDGFYIEVWNATATPNADDDYPAGVLQGGY